MFHIVGQDHFSEKSGFFSLIYETSLAVRMFFAIATGEVPVHEPANGFRTVRLAGEERYCLGCCGVRWHDVVEGMYLTPAPFPNREGENELSFRIARCRVCEKVGEV